MRPPPDDPDCSILRLPYEILKPILADLDRSDQLSIAKTCVRLWELAYPMAYDRIVVNSSPEIADVVWRNLASGVGLRYVRHLEVHAPGQSVTKTDKPKHAADLVAGILFAALRRHQLLSFSLTHPASTVTTMSVKNLIVLLETQQQLNQLELPGIRGSSGICITDYFPKSLQFHHLRDITFQLPTSNASKSMNSFIVHKSLSLNSFHLRLSAQGEEARSCIFKIPTHSPLSQGILFSMATKLTILGYDFVNISISPVVPAFPTFPALRALAVVDCKNSILFYSRVRPELFPRLQALLFKDINDLPGDYAARFIGRLSCLRELVICGGLIYFRDSSWLRPHAQTLELLALHHMARCSVFMAEDDQNSTLSTLTALRHANFHLGSFNGSVRSGINTDGKTEIAGFHESIANCSGLQTLTLRCDCYISPEYLKGHPAPFGFTKEDVALLSDSTYLEKLISDAILLHRDSVLDTDTLEYLTVITKSSMFSPRIPAGGIERMKQRRRDQKYILSVQPKQVLRPADQAKKEMMTRYAGDNYYFLEAYIDTMVELSPIKLYDRVGDTVYSSLD